LSKEQVDGKLARRETKDALDLSNSRWQTVQAQQLKHYNLKLHHSEEIAQMVAKLAEVTSEKKEE
jgi:hypothetical protein